MRVFYGVVFNDVTKNRIFDIQQELAKISDKGRFVPKDNFHITLRFIGEIPPNKLDDYGHLLFDALKDFPKFKMTTSYVGSFSRGSKILPWLSIKESEELIDLQNTLQATLIKNLSIGSETFTPHITLGRDVELQKSLNTLKVEPFDILVNRLALFESKNSDGRLNYIERAVVHLL